METQSAFKDEAEMMLAGNFAILGILAHEMGHAADYQYEIGRSGPTIMKILITQ
ncbi:MAG: hypothetical protein IPM85_17220 [Chitinophagaceae bacterium]|nr:hypothetical protein [Chitinophagaceae bacterium]